MSNTVWKSMGFVLTSSFLVRFDFIIMQNIICLMALNGRRSQSHCRNWVCRVVTTSGNHLICVPSIILFVLNSLPENLQTYMGFFPLSLL